MAAEIVFAGERSVAISTRITEWRASPCGRFVRTGEMQCHGEERMKHMTIVPAISGHDLEQAWKEKLPDLLQPGDGCEVWADEKIRIR